MKTINCKICGKTEEIGKFYEYKLICADCLNKPFQITSVCRVDLLENYSEKEIIKLDDGDMEEIASKMSDAYCDNGFWIDLPITVDYIMEDK